MSDNQRQVMGSKDEEVSVLVLIRLLLEKLHWVILSGAIVGIATYLVFSFLVAPTYQSVVSFYVYNSSNGSTQTGTIDKNDLQAAESLATTYSKILESNSVLNAVLENLDNEISRKDLSGMTSVSVVNGTQLLKVVVTSTDPFFACEVAQSFANIAPDQIIRITKAGGVEVVDSPEVATEKSSPRTIFDTAVGVALGMILSAVVIILRAVSDHTIYLPEDVERLTGITVLGQIPEIDVTENNYTRWKMIQGGEIRNEQTENDAPVNG